MFSISDTITDLKVKERKIFKIFYSMNSHPVSMPGYANEDARCYILFFSEGPNLSSFIGLYLTNVDKRFFYCYTSNPFPFEAENDVEDEARAFAEEMGFLLDEINVSGMAVEDRNTWIEEQFIFGYRRPESAKSDAEPAAPEPAAPENTKPAVKTEIAAPAPDIFPETPAAFEVIAEKEAAPQLASPLQAPQPVIEPLQPAPQQIPPQQPAQGYPPPQPTYPPQQPPQGYSIYPPQLQPLPGRSQEEPPVPEQLEPPVLDHPEEPAEAPQRPKAKPAPVQSRGLARKKPQPASHTSTAAVEKNEEELPVELEYEAPVERPRSLFEEAIKEGVVKPPRPKAAKAGAHSPTGIVSRDKEALARLLASF